MPCVPWFLDRHDVPGRTAAEVAAAHELDLEVQERLGVNYLTYWFDPNAGSVFCLAEGPDKEAVAAVHANSHGLMAGTIIEVERGPLDAFLGPPPVHPPGEAYVASGVRAIAFTDICGSTELTQRLGDQASLGLVRSHDELVRGVLADFEGREVKHTGDGIMASFASVEASVGAAVVIQRGLLERNRSAEVPITLRIGIAAGEPITDRGDLFGAAVQLAARLCAAASPGGIVVSDAVREGCTGDSLRFRDLGGLDLKGFAGPTPAFEVAWQ
jgi:class 3 adenylate cyclase